MILLYLFISFIYLSGDSLIHLGENLYLFNFILLGVNPFCFFDCPSTLFKIYYILIDILTMVLRHVNNCIMLMLIVTEHIVQVLKTAMSADKTAMSAGKYSLSVGKTGMSVLCDSYFVGWIAMPVAYFGLPFTYYRASDMRMGKAVHLCYRSALCASHSDTKTGNPVVCDALPDLSFTGLILNYPNQEFKKYLGESNNGLININRDYNKTAGILHLKLTNEIKLFYILTLQILMNKQYFLTFKTLAI
ncbi:MAG: hypothetical protein IPH57_05120 [Saprospiraceae bacterium]|nr:hypothetical protein [Saprospiraceae bacterium]